MNLLVLKLLFFVNCKNRHYIHLLYKKVYTKYQFNKYPFNTNTLPEKRASIFSPFLGFGLIIQQNFLILVV